MYKRIIRQGLLSALLLFNIFFASAQTSVSSEYRIKAVFLFNFSQFVEWNPNSFASDQGPFIIGVLGDNPFGSYLEDVVAGEKVNGHPLVVYHYKSLDEIKSCHILFINRAEINNMEVILKSLKGKNILSVSDTPDFLLQGGMVRFFTKNNKIQLQINLDAAKAAQLDISSKLLRCSEIYVPK